MPERILSLSREVSEVATRKLLEIQRITRQTRILAINALIEAAHAGEKGAGFAVVAQEVGSVSQEINKVSDELQAQLTSRVQELDRLGKSLIANIRGTRLADLALNMIEIIDRNLYERSCDVRWWATDSAVVDCLSQNTLEKKQFASKRLGVILDSYTVYLDIWIIDTAGNVVANGRPNLYPNATKQNVHGQSWFEEALHTADGTEFAVADISINPALEGRTVATYATAVREGGEVNGRVLGVLGIFFDWHTQSQAVVNGVRLQDDEKDRTRCMLLDSKFQVIASSDEQGVLQETVRLQTEGKPIGNFSLADGSVVGFALTPGYETYKGLGWYGAIAQKPPSS